MNHCMQYADPKAQIACIHSNTLTDLRDGVSVVLITLIFFAFLYLMRKEDKND